MSLDHFKNQYGLSDQSFILLPYGSRVYGTASDKSDEDYMAVVLDRKCGTKTGEEYRHGNVNIHIYNRDDWQEQLHQHKIHTLEAYYLPDKLCKAHFQFKLDKTKLRHSLVEKASHSFVKAKKKIEVEKDYYVGWKSLFHSLRILTFGQQMAESGSITDYAAANHYWFEILNNPNYQWAYFKEKYQPIYNQLSTEFRKVAPK